MVQAIIQVERLEDTGVELLEWRSSPGNSHTNHLSMFENMMERRSDKLNCET
jgi:hypothetical protein